jgi:hypothetical protein
LCASWTDAAGVEGATAGAEGLGGEMFSEGKQAIAQIINTKMKPAHVD